VLAREPIQRRIWRFAGCEADAIQWRLTVHGRDVELERKPLQLLFELVQRPNEVITKDELLGAVWPASVVADGSLTTAISKLRSALRDDEQQLLVTVPGVGYRLAAVVTVDSGPPALPGDPDTEPARQTGRTRSRPWLIPAVSALGLTLIAILYLNAREDRAPARRRG
jgi:DNA-binding winged helix-turn-helix (wHTH) protein